MLKKRNKLGKMLLIIMSASILSSVSVFAEEKSNLNQGIVSTTNNIKETSASDFDFDTTTGTITKYNGSDPEVVIPSKINGVNVTSIGKGAFTTLVGNGGVISNDYITSVIIPNGVTSIGDYAFTDDGLTNVVIPNSVTSIGEKAFYKCTKVNNMTIPDSVMSIGHNAFSGVKALYVDSERVQSLINASGRTDGIILKNRDTVNSNTSTQTSVSNETSNAFKWEKNSDGTWKLTKGGIVQTGWQQVNGKWYLINSNGIMLTGWQPVNGKWYYLYSSGEMASNTTIGEYKVASDGAWEA
jgi:hypothetical protein